MKDNHFMYILFHNIRLRTPYNHTTLFGLTLSASRSLMEVSGKRSWLLSLSHVIVGVDGDIISVAVVDVVWMWVSMVVDMVSDDLHMKFAHDAAPVLLCPPRRPPPLIGGGSGDGQNGIGGSGNLYHLVIGGGSGDGQNGIGGSGNLYHLDLQKLCKRKPGSGSNNFARRQSFGAALDLQNLCKRKPGSGSNNFARRQSFGAAFVSASRAGSHEFTSLLGTYFGSEIPKYAPPPPLST
nr:hypothetical protein [Tanacetum cinerariifolium]